MFWNKQSLSKAPRRWGVGPNIVTTTYINL
jgi:hypothetical protein